MEAIRLSLLEHEGPAGRPEERFRVHTLLAELLARKTPREPVLARVTDWFVARLPERPAGSEEEQGRAWGEVHAETAALVEWLRAVPPADLRRVHEAGSRFAQRCGPFAAWVEFCERGLAEAAEPGDRSHFLWTLGQVSHGGGDLDRALAAAREKQAVDRDRGQEREAALAAGLTADILQARGELDGALRIRREEELPVYQRLGDVRSLLAGRTNVAITLLQRGRPGDRDEARQLFLLALAAARKLRIPEAAQIEELLASLGPEDVRA